MITSVLREGPEDHYEKFHADGIKTCMELLDELRRGQVKGGFLN